MEISLQILHTKIRKEQPSYFSLLMKSVYIAPLKNIKGREIKSSVKIRNAPFYIVNVRITLFQATLY